MFKDLTSQFPIATFLSLDYRPPRWESPMEQKLLQALRYLGLGVETQVPVGNDHVDMIVFGRSSPNEVIIECDGIDFHHNLIDEFRDDELIETAGLPIAHVAGTEIAESSERCALYIAEKWFPKIIDTQGYASAQELAYGKNKKRPEAGISESFPVGVIRPI